MFDASAKDEPWWPLEWAENHYSGYPESKPVFHPIVSSIDHNVGSHEWYFYHRKNGAQCLTIKGTGHPVEDEITLRCALLELAYPGGNDGSP